MPPVQDFEHHRPRLTVLAYRMLGSVQAAEDVVQEAWLRFERTDPKPDTMGWFHTVVSRLCLDELKSARSRRETYPGPWLPEPWEDGRCDVLLERSADLGVALWMVLDTLPPAQRVADVLREALDVDTPELAATLGTSEANVRQLLRRARSTLATAPSPPRVTPEHHAAVVARYGAALQRADVAALTALLTDDAVSYSDGGGVIRAAKVPVVGGPKIAKAMTRTMRQYPPTMVPVVLSCNQDIAVGVVVEGVLVNVSWFGVQGDRVHRVWSVLHPPKLQAVAEARGWSVLSLPEAAPAGLERLVGLPTPRSAPRG
jgi:RNA polymerase sigma-70 factor (ECF subfamily)